MENTKAKPAGGRIWGVDALRLIAMLMVVTLHVLNKGALWGSIRPLSARDMAVSLLAAACYPAVNCYALISGYVGVESRHRYGGLALTWLKVWLYSALAGILFFLFQRADTPVIHLIRSLIPAFQGIYWYFTAYLVLFLSMPLLNAGLKALDRRRAGVILMLLFVCFSVVPTASKMLPGEVETDPFLLNSGYSALWLAWIYLLGGYMRLHDPFGGWSRRRVALIALAALLLCWLSRGCFLLLGRWIGSASSRSKVFYHYISPLNIIFAAALLELFSRMQVKGFARKVVAALSPMCFSVYLIHAHPLTFTHLFAGRFAALAEQPWPLIVPLTLLIALGIFLACCAIDWLRIRLFEALHLKERLSELIDVRLLKSSQE